MIDPYQLSAFGDELLKIGARPWIHGATAATGGGLALGAYTPFAVKEHERDVRDVHLGNMSAEMLKVRDMRRLRQAAVLGATATTLGALAPFAVEYGVRKARPGVAEQGARARAAVDAAAEAAKGHAVDAARRAAGGVADAFVDKAEALGHGAARGIRRGMFGRARAPAAADASSTINVPGAGIFDRIFR